MDFIVLYSKYSNRCKYLFEEIPLLADKGVSIDSPEARKNILLLPCKITRVPTLLITDGVSSVIKTVEGAENIKNWFILTTYSMSAEPPAVEEIAIQPRETVDHLMPPTMTGSTSLDSLLIDDEEVEDADIYSLKSDKTMNTKSLAETLQRERESFLEQTESGGPNQMPRGR